MKFLLSSGLLQIMPEIGIDIQMTMNLFTEQNPVIKWKQSEFFFYFYSNSFFGCYIFVAAMFRFVQPEDYVWFDKTLKRVLGECEMSEEIQQLANPTYWFTDFLRYFH